MPKLQDFNTPLVYKVDDSEATVSTSKGPLPSQLSYRVDIRSLDGMQKEAVVRQLVPPGATWRLVSDEGPYLNGTDLAPFPLAFFAAGLQFCYMSQLVELLRANKVNIHSLAVDQDTKYTMTGSALRGDMIGEGVPAELTVKLESDASPEILAPLVMKASDLSPAHAVMRDLFTNTFALQLNGKQVSLSDMAPSPNDLVVKPQESFHNLQPATNNSFRENLVTKIKTAEVKHGVTGGAGSSLQAEQKRTLHIHSEARLVGNDLFETDIHLFQPLGSSFRFLCDAAGGTTAPGPLAYLSAGVGFCYMTQLGRYAYITKQNVRSSQIVQFNDYLQPGPNGTSAKAGPTDTQVFMDAEETDESAKRSVRMGEQTCFLHGSMRETYPTIIRATLNSKTLPLP